MEKSKDKNVGIFKDKKGGTFTMKVASDDEISVLEGGYLITLDGQFIPVKDDQNHDEVFSEYINKYECADVPRYYDTVKAFEILLSAGNVVYMGKKLGDDTTSNNGAFILLIPNQALTPKQNEAVEKLIATNVSYFSGNPIVELMLMHLNGTPVEFSPSRIK